MKNIIIGKSFISKELKKKIPNSSLVSAEEFMDKNFKINNKVNIIINSFYPVSKLHNIESYENFFEKSIISLSKILDKIKSSSVEKIIYTSSSAVYGSIIDNSHQNDVFNRNLYSYTKLCCENLIKNFSDKKKINFIITRVFNCYDKSNSFCLNKILVNKETSKNYSQ